MSPERPDLPEWARRDREMDTAWIHKNLDIFWPRARNYYESIGRFAFMVLTPDEAGPAIYEIGYLTQEGVEEYGHEDLKRMVREYEPASEFVLSFLRVDGRESCYRVQVQRKGSNGRG